MVEGRVYPMLEAKAAAFEAELERWDAGPEQVRRLTGWPWIMETMKQFPQPQATLAWSGRFGISDGLNHA